jgi:dipeptidyl aminopeptidase/acylaminoacyl peptidase
LTYSRAASPARFVARVTLALLLTIILLGAPIAFAGRFDFPKENPQVSIQMPNNWHAGFDGDKVTAHPANNSKVVISVFPISDASNLKDAFVNATKQFSATYQDVKIGKLAEQKQAGITFYGGQGEGEKDGFELTLAVAAFSPDGKSFFGLAWTRDEAFGDAYIKDIDKALASIQPFKELPKPPK